MSNNPPTPQAAELALGPGELLDTGEGHRLWWSQSGPADAPAVLVVHGGPGGRSRPDPWSWLEGLPVLRVCWDQRGCGRSQPPGRCEDNTLSHLLDDVDRLRERLGGRRLALLAGSWGAVPALQYALLRPQAVWGLLLRSPFLARPEEIAAYFSCWDRWLGPAGLRLLGLGQEGTAALLARREAATPRLLQAWQAFEQAHAGPGGSAAAAPWRGPRGAPEPGPLAEAQASWQVFVHFLRHACFLPDDAPARWQQMLAGWRQGPLAFVHGESDATCPVGNTRWLQQAAGGAARVRLVPGAGHRISDPLLAPVLREEARRWARQLSGEGGGAPWATPAGWAAAPSRFRSRDYAAKADGIDRTEWRMEQAGQGGADRLAASQDSIHAMLDLFVEQTEDLALMFLDPEGRIIAWRGAAERILGYREDEVLGRPVALIFTGRDQQLDLPAYERRVAASDGRAEDDRWHVRRDGTEVWLTGATTALRDGQGQLLGFAKTVRDRTDLRTQLETLENRVAQLDRMHRDKDAFFARLTHELRNSLGPMRNGTALMKRATQPEQHRMALGIVERQLDFLVRMTADLSELARVGVGKLDLMQQRIDLSRELPALLDAVRDRAAQKGVGLELLIAAAAIEVDADRERLHQIVYNLLDNAIKYTLAGGRIWVKLNVEDRYAVLRVQDSGEGIAPAALPRIFDLFTQEHPTGAKGGFGVGLALVKELVDAHRGSVEVRSEGKGRGSEFTVRLPLQQAVPRSA
ncbi:alpha/beta fold hydrolase [Aquabacterium sp. A7-Y]|uniref:alpha/beta fold hydrolase n=1 Tax=Aquabacterium sp. A7-Y TaxID=1349605 RepID=UPI00223E5601|nr:alpha/beta fold hydrolase [Aquabacterium sp. A7-Y]MCW7541732.1 alpha/beta fold hydrolase [Aquabacterium sp. A7-Y]